MLERPIAAQHDIAYSRRFCRSINFRIFARGGLILAACLASRATVRGDSFVYDTPDSRHTVEGRLVSRNSAEVLFLGRDGRMHLVNSNRVMEVKETEEKPKPFTKDEMVAALRSEFGNAFRVHTTNRYIICYSSTYAFAKSCGTLFERLSNAFTNYFEQQAHMPVEPNEYPLVAIIFDSEQEFLAYATQELGDEMARNVIGYYSMLTNRMVLYDMQAGAGRAGLGQVARKRPGGIAGGIDALPEVNVATIIHEATHQLAYNCGFHQRFSDNPLWLAEGMGMFFEAPNRQAATWRGIGEVNRLRLDTFREQHLGPNAKPVNLPRLVQTDELLRDRKTALAAYADSWSLVFFLMKSRREQLFNYLRILREKPPLDQDTPEQRLADFKSAFGPDIAKLEEEFVRYMRSLR
jgi:hypothetical protein